MSVSQVNERILQSELLTLGSNKELLLDLVSVGITEVDDSKRSATAGVMDDVTDDTLKTVNVNIIVESFPLRFILSAR